MSATDKPQSRAVASAKAMWARDGASQRMGMKIATLQLGRAVVTMTVRDDMINGHGTCHGSFIFALADTAFALACNSHGPASVAADCQISFLMPVHLQDRLAASASETYRRGRTGVYDVVVTRGNGETVAVFRGKSRSIADGPTNAAEGAQ